MKRSEALAEIKWAGWHGDSAKAALIAAQKGIGSAAYRREYQNGLKMKSRGEPCGCTACTAEGKTE